MPQFWPAEIVSDILSVYKNLELSKACRLWQHHGLPIDTFQEKADPQKHESVWMSICRQCSVYVHEMGDLCSYPESGRTNSIIDEVLLKALTMGENPFPASDPTFWLSLTINARCPKTLAFLMHHHEFPKPDIIDKIKHKNYTLSGRHHPVLMSLTHDIARLGNGVLMKEWLDKGMNPNVSFKNNPPPVAFVCRDDVLKVLLDHHVSVDVADPQKGNLAQIWLEAIQKNRDSNVLVQSSVFEPFAGQLFSLFGDRRWWLLQT